MTTVYFYPKIDYRIAKSPNAYIPNLERAISKGFTVVNRTYNKKGVLDLFLHLFRSDIYLFNWIENLPFKKYGKLQAIFFSIFLFCVKILKKKIVWILHNKYPHDQPDNRWINYMFNILMKRSSLIVTHAASGVDFVKENFPKAASRVKYIVHPVLKPFPRSSNTEKKYDFLIWGVIYPYKGVPEFLNFISQAGIPSVRVLIIGKCFDEELKRKIGKYLSGNIIHLDQFFEIKEIAKFADQSKFILFNYKSTSVLSSGALMDSIRMGATIIGRDISAFRDLGSFSFIKTFNHYEEILDMYYNYKPYDASLAQEADNFYFENSWERFAEKIAVELNQL